MVGMLILSGVSLRCFADDDFSIFLGEIANIGIGRNIENSL